MPYNVARHKHTNVPVLQYVCIYIYIYIYLKFLVLVTTEIPY